MTRANEIIKILDLKPLPDEGGYYREVYRSEETIPQHILPPRYTGDRSMATAIYYLLTPDSFSRMHRVLSDEIFSFYLGDPVEMLLLYPDGLGKIHTLGNDLLNGMQPQIIVPKGVWQGARLHPGGAFALLGTVVAPGFEFEDYEAGERSMLIEAHGEFRDLITALTLP